MLKNILYGSPNRCRKLRDAMLEGLRAEFPDGGAGLPDKDEDADEKKERPREALDPWEFYPEITPTHMSF